MNKLINELEAELDEIRALYAEILDDPRTNEEILDSIEGWAGDVAQKIADLRRE